MIKLAQPFKLWHAEASEHLTKLASVSAADLSKEDAIGFFRQMFEIRRVEVACDGEYKARRIRGFLHLMDGQEAVCTGVNAVMAPREAKDPATGDDWITTYRCHGVALCRGVTPKQVFAELFGAGAGASRGKGGSMHLYRKEANFFGGAGIVGAHVPVAAGLAFAQKYRATNPDKAAKQKKMGFSIVFYGDGAANQGQVWEAANMAKLWQLPVVFLIENNQYGMGTSSERSSALTEYYKQGGEVIPGIQVNGMDVLAVREAARHAREHAVAGNGPVFIEAKTYRYHGHSMSDPGVTYRTREEIANTRAQRDPIELLRMHILASNYAKEEELKEMEREIRNNVQKALTEALAAPVPEPKDLVTDVYTTGEEIVEQDGRLRMKSEFPAKIRMPDRTKTFIFAA